MQLLAGIVLVKTGKILLVHPTGAAPEGTWSIPKGHQDEGEPTIDAAIRETYEEIGIEIPRRFLQGELPRRVYKGRKKLLFYWVIRVPEDYPDRLPARQLQAKEVDKAEFFDLLDADYYIEDWQRDILNAVPCSPYIPKEEW